MYFLYRIIYDLAVFFNAKMEITYWKIHLSIHTDIEQSQTLRGTVGGFRAIKTNS